MTTARYIVGLISVMLLVLVGQFVMSRASLPSIMPRMYLYICGFSALTLVTAIRLRFKSASEWLALLVLIPVGNIAILIYCLLPPQKSATQVS